MFLGVASCAASRLLDQTLRRARSGCRPWLRARRRRHCAVPRRRFAGRPGDRQHTRDIPAGRDHPRLVEADKRRIACRARKVVIDMSDTIVDPDAPPRRGPQRRRRLSDHIMVAFHSACDQEELDAAQGLIAIVEFMLRRAPPDGRPERRDDTGLLVAAHLRLWSLRHPEARDDTWSAPPRDRRLAADRRGTVRD
jgi:hypothetical protein